MKKPAKKKLRGGVRKGAGRPKRGPLVVPDDIAKPLLEARDGDEYLAALMGVARAGLIPGPDGKPRIDRASAKLAIELGKEVRQGLRIKALEPSPSEVSLALELLTADEYEALERYRAAKRTPPLKPGDAPPPPPEEAKS